MNINEITPRRYWRIGTSDEKESYWDLMLADSKTCIGWSNIGDLNKAGVQSKLDIEQLLRNKNYYPTNNSTLSAKAREIFNFYSSIKTGDIILAQKGAVILGIGIISGEYIYNNENTFAHQKRVDWKIIKPDLKNKDENLRTTVREIFPNALTNQIDVMLNFQDDLKINIKKSDRRYPLNQILYGPPGTGKTYETISRAVAIIDGLSEEEQSGISREGNRLRYEELKEKGQIVFCTFHQSMAYEDFIEGIKPVMLDDDLEQNLGYRVEDGIFKRLCTIAKYDFYKSVPSNASYNISRAELFNRSYAELLSDFEERLDQEQDVQIESITGLNLYVTQITNQLNLKIKHESAQRERPYTVSKQRLFKLFTYFNNVKEIKNIHKDIRGVIGGSNTTAYWAVLSLLFKLSDTERTRANSKSHIDEPNQNYEIIKSVANSLSIPAQNLIINDSAKYVLIIDEINRGNVSQIFGELITLLEEDKRLGQSEQLETTLPYSKEKFGIPPTLYVLGTMNTADRSVEALDTALRRRFSFEELLPRPSVLKDLSIGGFSIDKILEKINYRIERILDRDHQIGHSYFLGIKNIDDLKTVFQSKIIPLLQEYFYGDYGKIGLVLGRGFVYFDVNRDGNPFAVFDYEDSNYYIEKTIYKLNDISKMDDSAFMSALKLLLD